jgi:glycopeptide antibiotics resistance protein
VLKQTVWRSGVQQRTVSLVPFQCYLTVLQGGEKELIRSAFMNVLLFYPGGILARCLWKNGPLWKLTLLFLLGSVAVECCQYGFSVGTAETDDIIHNTLGAFLGMLSSEQYQARQRSSK